MCLKLNNVLSNGSEKKTVCVCIYIERDIARQKVNVAKCYNGLISVMTLWVLMVQLFPFVYRFETLQNKN